MNSRAGKQQGTVRMRCSKFRKWVVLAEDTDRSLRWEVAIREHWEGCPGCRRFAQEMQAVRRLLRVQRPVGAPAGFTREVMARVRESGGRVRGPRPSRYLRRPARRGALVYGLAMVAVLAVLMAGGFLFRGAPSWNPSGEAMPASAVIAGSVPAGGDAMPELLQQLVLAHREHVADRCFTHCCVPPCRCGEAGVGGLCVHG